MDIRQITNIIAIEEEGNIARAAEKLFLTQSALNQQLLKLEHELGTPLFERQRHRMVPTPAGRVYLEKARQIVDIKEEAYRIIGDYANETAGEISIVYTPERGSRMFAAIFPTFREKYPAVTVHTFEARNRKMEQMLLHKDVTLACMSYTSHTVNAEFSYYAKVEEPFVIAYPATHEHAAKAGEDSHLHPPVIDLTLLKDEEFIMHTRETLSRSVEDRAFSMAGYTPKVLFETSSSAVALEMVRKQFSPAIMQQGYAQKDPRIVYFRFEPFPTWTICVATRKDAYLTIPERYLVRLISEYHHRELVPEAEHV